MLIQEYDATNWAVYRAAGDGPSCHLCSDNPLVISDLAKGYRFLSPIAFPVSTERFVYYTPNGQRPAAVHPDARIELDCLVFRQADRYVCGPNADYIKAIAELNELHEQRRDLQAHKDYLFSLFQEPTSGHLGAEHKNE